MLNVDEGSLFWLADAKLAKLYNNSKRANSTQKINNLLKDLRYKTFVKSGPTNSIETVDGLTVITLKKSTKNSTFCWPQGFQVDALY